LEVLIYSRLLVVSSFPLYYLILCAPNLPFVLLGLSIFLFLTRDRQLSNRYLAGVAVGFCAIKPHVLPYLFLLIFTDSLKTRSIKTILGIGTTGITLLGAAIIYQNDIFFNYLKAVPHFPNAYLTPTLNRWIVDLFELPIQYVALYAIIPLFLVTLYFYRQNSKSNSELILIAIFASILFAPYLWTYEFFLLVPIAFITLAEATGSQRKAIFYLYLTGNLLLIITSGFHMGWQFWYPSSMLIGFLMIRYFYHRKLTSYGNRS